MHVPVLTLHTWVSQSPCASHSTHRPSAAQRSRVALMSEHSVTTPDPSHARHSKEVASHTGCFASEPQPSAPAHAAQRPSSAQNGVSVDMARHSVVAPVPSQPRHCPEVSSHTGACVVRHSVLPEHRAASGGVASGTPASWRSPSHAWVCRLHSPSHCSLDVQNAGFDLVHPTSANRATAHMTGTRRISTRRS